MELLLIRGFETVAILAAILTTGALLGAIVGRLTFGAYMRKGSGKLAAHDRLRDDTDRTRVDLHTVVSRAIIDAVNNDRSNRSRKGWQTRRQDRDRQRDSDLKTLMGMETNNNRKGRE
jgi:hypothetical protein